MEDAVAGFQVAPLWAQIAMVLFAAMVVVAIVEPAVRRRKFRRHFEAIASGLAQAQPAQGELTGAFRACISDRDFEVRYDPRSRSKGSSYRGPTGHLLITATRLASDRWSMHQVDISKPGRLGLWLASGRRSTGDADFDARFLVVEDGLPARDGWLDRATRKAIVQFLDEAPLPGVIWIREGELSFTMQNPWTGVDGPAIRTLLERQSALASALDRTARPKKLTGIRPSH